MRKVRRMKEEGKKTAAEGEGIVTQGRDGSPSGPKSQARSAVSRTGAAPAYVLRDSGLGKPPRKWDAYGETSLPIPFEGRCRADCAFDIPSHSER